MKTNCFGVTNQSTKHNKYPNSDMGIQQDIRYSEYQIMNNRRDD